MSWKTGGLMVLKFNALALLIASSIFLSSCSPHFLSAECRDANRSIISKAVPRGSVILLPITSDGRLVKAPRVPGGHDRDAVIEVPRSFDIWQSVTAYELRDKVKFWLVDMNAVAVEASIVEVENQYGRSGYWPESIAFLEGPGRYRIKLSEDEGTTCLPPAATESELCMEFEYLGAVESEPVDPVVLSFPAWQQDPNLRSKIKSWDSRYIYWEGKYTFAQR
ncbi:MAG: hypothetical protein AAFP00_07295, partial [Bacteroidota bacterium]